MAAGMAIESLFQGTDSAALKIAQEYITRAKDTIDKMQRPYDDDGMKLSSFSARDITPEGINRVINILGQDISNYEGNENINFDDSQSISGWGFFWGRVW
jgi:hypothetical protein